MAIPPAPSAPPTSVRVSEVTSSSITVQWGPVDCIHRNGDITGYSVRYRRKTESIPQNISVSGGNAIRYTIPNLNSSTKYFIRVAAINNAGNKLFSRPVNNLTRGMLIP